MDITKKVLIVDDDEDALLVTGKKLKDAGYAVITAKTGEGALQAAAKEKPALIVLDLGLPDIDGTEVCTRLKADNALRAIPIMIFTARTSNKFSQGPNSAHIAGVYLKSFGFEKFLAAVEAILEG